MITDNLLVELGTEELPPKALKALGLAFRDGITAGLERRGLDFGEVIVGIGQGVMHVGGLKSGVLLHNLF